MSDRLEEIKTKWKTVKPGYTGSLSEDDVDYLIAEVERLYQNQLDRNTMELEMEGEIESLTKERDELLNLISQYELIAGYGVPTLVDKAKTLEAENAKLKERVEDLLLRGNIKCTACGAIFPDPHKEPCI